MTTKKFKECNFCSKVIKDYLTVGDVPKEGSSHLYYVGKNHTNKRHYSFSEDLDFCNLDCFINDVKKKMDVS